MDIKGTDDLTMIPYIAYESALSKAEKREKRKDLIIIVLIATIALLFGSLMLLFSKYDFVGYQQYISGGSVDEQNINDGIHIENAK